MIQKESIVGDFFIHIEWFYYSNRPMMKVKDMMVEQARLAHIAEDEAASLG